MKTKYIYSNLKYGVLFLLLASIIISCDDLVDEVPVSEIAPVNYWKNNNDAQAGVMAIYDVMQAAYRENYFLWGEFRSDSYKRGSASATANSVEIVTNNVTEGNQDITRWNTIYSMVNRANLAIKNIPTISGYEQNLLGEALALRAYAYFTMIKVWGAVPLFTEPTALAGPDLYKPRTDASTIMETIIIPDMKKAEELIASPSNDYRWSKASIYAFQADVYMWLKDYGKAKVALDKLVALNSHKLVTTTQAWASLFYNNASVYGPFLNLNGETEFGRGKEQKGSELIFSIFYDQSDPQQGNGDSRGNRSGIAALFYAGLPAYYISTELEEKWTQRFPVDSVAWVTKYPKVIPPLIKKVVVANPTTGAISVVDRPVYGDARYFSSREGFTNLTTPKSGEARVAKWHKFNYNSNFDDTDIVLYRYAGQLLLLAEAENQLGNTTKALSLVNEIRKARQLPLVTSAEFGATIEARENYILDERQFELLGEGSRVWDLIRTGKFVETMNTAYAKRGEQLINQNRILLPIYFQHFQENPNLGSQNPGYGAN